MRSGIAIGMLAAALAAAAEPRWIRVVSPHFEMYSSASAGSARDALRDFEQVRGFFVQVAGHEPANPVPIRIVAFGSAKEYEAVRINQFAQAFYQSTADRDFIVIGPAAAGTTATAIHEYVHLVVRHSNLRLPPWLNEGVAELYSTIKPMGDKILVGALVPGRQAALFREPWVPLSTIVTADQNSPFYNEKDKAGSLYNEGWALTHMLALRDGYRPKFGELLTALNDGATTAEAFRAVYGKSVAELDRELRQYLAGDRFQGVLIPAKLEKRTEKLEAEPVEAFDVKLTLAMILNRPGREAESRGRFAELAVENARRPEPHAELAYLEWRSGNRAAAMPEFEKAYALGERGSRFLWDYGRMAESEPRRAIPVLQQLLSQSPDRMDVRLEIAEIQVRAGMTADALATLAPVRQVKKADAARLFRLAALAQWQAGHRDLARSAAGNFVRNATGDAERIAAEKLLAMMSRPTLEGAFERLDCSGKEAWLVLKTVAGTRTLRIEDPARVVVTGQAGNSVELACGPQAKAAEVTVEYEPPDVVRSIHFQ